MFWIQSENGVDNTQMFWVFCLAAFILSQEHFSLTHALPVRRYMREIGREQSWDGWPKLTTGIFHTTSCPASAGGSSLEGRPAWVWEGGLASVRGWWAIAFCITGFSHFITNIIIIIYHYHYILLYCQLSQPKGFTWILLPNPLRWGGEREVEWMTAWCLISNWA